MLPNIYFTSFNSTYKKIINNQHIIIDSKSGVSGAGKKLEVKNLFSEINENFYSYGLKNTSTFLKSIKKFQS